MNSLADVPAVVLVGGLGSRLRSVAGETPKPMVTIAGRPFLEHLVGFLKGRGVKRVVLCVGHGAEAIRSHFGEGGQFGLEIRYSVEQTEVTGGRPGLRPLASLGVTSDGVAPMTLLGTGGAIRLGVRTGKGRTSLVLNGDSFVDLDLEAMLRSHREAHLPVTMALVAVEDTSRFGAVVIDQGTGRAREFGEKRQSGPGLINAGVYLVEREVAESIPTGVVSFERDVLPGLLESGLNGFVTQGFFVDIGVPEDYHRLAAEPRSFLAAAGARHKAP